MNEQSTIVAEEKSTHSVETFTLEQLLPHDNADTLSIIKISDTDYTYIAKTEEWLPHIGKKLFWCPPDSLVNTTLAPFHFLVVDAKFDKDSNKVSGGNYARVRAKKLRGVNSYGILGVVPEEYLNHPNLAKALDIQHFEPQIEAAKGSNLKTGGEVASPPAGTYPKYDVDAFLKYARKVFVPDELVCIVEKIHGANSRYIYKDGKLHCGSRTEWKKEFPSPPKLTIEELITKVGSEERAKEIYEKAVVHFKPHKNLWWLALESTPNIRAYLEKHEGYCAYGEVYGQVQKGYNYGLVGTCKVMLFDILLPSGKWMDAVDFLKTCREYNLPHCPVIHEAYPFNLEEIVKFAEGKSLMENASNPREGCVVAPVRERWDERLGRVKLKIINPEYK